MKMKMRRVEVKKIMKKNQVIITSLAILIAVAGYLNFADVDLGFKDKETSTDSSSILDDVDYDLTDETALLDENGGRWHNPVGGDGYRIPGRGRTYRCFGFCSTGKKSAGSRCVPRTKRTCRRSSVIKTSAKRKNRMLLTQWFHDRSYRKRGGCRASSGGEGL